MRNILMLAYVFPPFFSIGGSIRAVKFAKYLPENGWLPVVLSVDDRREYDTLRKQGSEALLRDIPTEVKIFRTGAGEPSLQVLNAGREMRRRSRFAGWIVNMLSTLRRWAGRYVLLPDRNITWLPFAVRSGRQIIREESIDVIFATCPPHSTAMAGAVLAHWTGRPLVLDFRDDWIDTPWYRTKPAWVRWVERRMEAWAVRTARRVILVTEYSRAAFLRRYPREPKEKFAFIPNGCDLDDYAGLAGADVQVTGPDFNIVHAGHLTDAVDWRRSPEAFFQAIVQIQREDPDLGSRLCVSFTGVLPETYRQMAARFGLGGTVKELGFVPQQKLGQLFQAADLLLTINFDGFATLIPGKIYEYWAAGGPPILLMSCLGAAQEFVESHSLGLAVDPHDTDAILEAIRTVYRRRAAGNPWRIQTDGIAEFDRKRLAGRLAGVLDRVVEGRF